MRAPVLHCRIGPVSGADKQGVGIVNEFKLLVANVEAELFLFVCRQGAAAITEPERSVSLDT